VPARPNREVPPIATNAERIIPWGSARSRTRQSDATCCPAPVNRCASVVVQWSRPGSSAVKPENKKIRSSAAGFPEVPPGSKLPLAFPPPQPQRRAGISDDAAIRFLCPSLRRSGVPKDTAVVSPWPCAPFPEKPSLNARAIDWQAAPGHQPQLSATFPRGGPRRIESAPRHEAPSKRAQTNEARAPAK